MKSLIVLLFLLLSQSTFAQAVSLVWDPNSETNLVGYKVYYGTSPRTYGTPITIGLDPSYTISGLGIGTWYFAVTAFNATQNESGFSNEVSTTIANLPLPVTISISTIPNPGPRVTLLLVSSILSYQATVVWQTDTECDGFALWSKDGVRWFSVTANHLGTTEHLAIISPLTSRTHYQYKVTGTCGSTLIESKVGSFNTK
jgi:hypothetical protein